MVEQAKDSVSEVSQDQVSKSRTEDVGKTREDQLLYLRTDEIVFPEELDVRPWSRLIGPTESEIEEIDKLAQTISEEGQIDPIKVMLGPDGEYLALTGSRRTAAIAQINAGKKKGEAELRVKAVLAEAPIKLSQAFRQAAISNIQRRALSPMDFAACIKTVKENVKGWGTPKKLAEYFAVSPATVTQHLKLLELDNDTQLKIHTGELSRDAAFALLDVKPEKRAEVLAKAKEQTQAEIQAQPTEEEVFGVDPAKAQAEAPKAKAKKAKDTKTIKSRAVKEAARETAGATDKPQPRSRKEIIDWARDNQGPAYGYPNGQIHKFLDAFVRHAAGEISTRTLDKWFSEMVAKADRGKPEPKGTKAQDAKADSKSTKAQSAKSKK